MSGKRRHRERESKRAALVERDKLDALARGVAVNPDALAPNKSISQPDFITRGYYVDRPFACQACGIQQVWTAAQQKWWYEVAKGDVFSTAKHCRPCRQQERARRDEARRRGGHLNP